MWRQVITGENDEKIAFSPVIGFACGAAGWGSVCIFKI